MLIVALRWVSVDTIMTRVPGNIFRQLRQRK